MKKVAYGVLSRKIRHYSSKQNSAGDPISQVEPGDKPLVVADAKTLRLSIVLVPVSVCQDQRYFRGFQVYLLIISFYPAQALIRSAG